MESPACDFEDWGDEDLQVLEECDQQDILDGKPKSQYFTSFPVIQASRYPEFQIHQSSSNPVFQSSSIRVFHKSSSIPVFQYAVSNSFRRDLAKYKSVGNNQFPLAFS